MTTTLRPLLCRSPLWPGESLPSFLLRLSMVNRYHSPHQVVALGRERLREADSLMHPTKTETYQVLSNLVKLETDELYGACAHRFATLFTPPPEPGPSVRLPSGQTQPLLSQALFQDHLWPVSQGRFCPLCLRAAAYHRVSWLPVAHTVCLQHQCLLVHRCPGCQSSLSVSALLKTKCFNCDFDLTTAPVIHVAADPFGLFSQQVVQAWSGLCSSPEIPAGYRLPLQPSSTLYRLLDGLYRAALRTDPTWAYLQPTPGEGGSANLPCLSKGDLTPLTAYVAYTTAFKGLVNWPQGFYDFLDAYQRRVEQPYTGQLPGSLGGLYQGWLEGYWQAPPFQFVQTAFDQYLLERYATTRALTCVNRMRKNPALWAKFPYLPLAESAQVLGATPELVKRLVQNGFLLSYQQLEKEALPQQFYLVSQASVQALRQRWPGALPLEVTAQLLGASEQMIQELIEAGLLEPLSTFDPEGKQSWRLSYQTITKFLSQLEGHLLRQRSIPKAPRLFVSLTQALDMLSPYGFKSAAIIKGVCEGDLRGYWPKGEHRLNHLEISSQDIATLIQSLRLNQPRLAHQQVAALMQVKPAIVSLWAARGLLSPLDEAERTLYFEREAALRFVIDHVLFEEAAELLGIGKSLLLKWLKQGRVQAVSGPAIDSLPYYLFRREQVEGYRKNWAKVFS